MLDAHKLMLDTDNFEKRQLYTCVYNTMQTYISWCMTLISKYRAKQNKTISIMTFSLVSVSQPL